MPIHGLGAYVIFFAFLAVVFAPFVLIAWWNDGADTGPDPRYWRQVNHYTWEKIPEMWSADGRRQKPVPRK